MGGFLGADVEQLRALARTLERGAQDLSSRLRSLDALVAEPGPWQGPDLLRFQATWHSETTPEARHCIQSLLSAARALQQQAQEQEKASVAAGGSGATGAGGAPPSVDGSDRRSQGRGAEGERGREGGGQGDPGGHTDGPQPLPNGLGKPVPGTSVPRPEAPPWRSDPDSQGHGTSDAGWGDHAKKLVVETAAEAGGAGWPDASRNLLHYLGNSGEPLTQNVDQMLKDVPQLRGQADADVTNLARSAVADAKGSGATGPVTYPVSTDWKGYYITKDQSANWFYATGGIQYSTQGQVTVYPPEQPGGEWRYVTDTAVSYRDRYNWDGTKATDIGPFHVTDAEMGHLNEVGLAQNFNMVGRSGNRHGDGTVS
nr:WXG100 family type VII secretion target [Arthrobacter sp.]